MSGPLQPYLSPSTFSTTRNGATVVPYAVRLPRNPTTADRDYPVGSVWANTASYEAFILTAIAGGLAQWAPCGISPLGDVRFLEGDSGGAVGPTANKIDIVGAAGSGITVVGNPGTSTLEIQSSSATYQGSATTVGAVTVTVLSIPVAADSTVVVEARIAGFEAATGVGGLLSVTAHQNGANFIVGKADLFKDVPPGLPGATFGVLDPAVGSNIDIQCTGSAGKTINWVVQALTTVAV